MNWVAKDQVINASDRLDVEEVEIGEEEETIGNTNVQAVRIDLRYSNYLQPKRNL